jgi:hypothetical protein
MPNGKKVALAVTFGSVAQKLSPCQKNQFFSPSENAGEEAGIFWCKPARIGADKGIAPDCAGCRE